MKKRRNGNDEAAFYGLADPAGVAIGRR